MSDAPPLRRYRGFMADSDRWRRFAFREGDVVITTPSKCGTTWMQSIVGMLVLGRPDLRRADQRLSPWLDMLVDTDEEVFGRLEATDATGGSSRPIRRWTASPASFGDLPLRDPSSARRGALRSRSRRQHARRTMRSICGWRRPAHQTPTSSCRKKGPRRPGDYLRWFIDNDNEPTGSGPYGLADYCQQILTYWDARERRTSTCSTTPTCGRSRCRDGPRRPRVGHPDRRGVLARVRRGGDDRFDARRAPRSRRRTADDRGCGGPPRGSSRWAATRGWASHLAPADLDHFHDGCRALAGDAAEVGPARSGRADVAQRSATRLRSVPMPSAASSTSAPGHRRRDGSASSSTGGNGPSANASPRSSTACSRRDAISSNSEAAAPLRLPFSTSLVVDLDLHEHRLRIDLVGGDDARPDRDGHARRPWRPARRRRTRARQSFTSV